MDPGNGLADRPNFIMENGTLEKLKARDSINPLTMIFTQANLDQVLNMAKVKKLTIMVISIKEIL